MFILCIYNIKNFYKNQLRDCQANTMCYPVESM
nr:MAG TPA: hypothetical protein [Caudoviricetes sp.]